MSLNLKPGVRLFGTACTSEFIVVKAPSDPVDLTIGGHPALTSAADRDAAAVLIADHDSGSAIGKRYVDDAETLELLCTKGGTGGPALGGEVLVLKEAKPLPASD